MKLKVLSKRKSVTYRFVFRIRNNNILLQINKEYEIKDFLSRIDSEFQYLFINPPFVSTNLKSTQCQLTKSFWIVCRWKSFWFAWQDIAFFFWLFEFGCEQSFGALGSFKKCGSEINCIIYRWNESNEPIESTQWYLLFQGSF